MLAEKKITIKENEYVINYPTAGQLMDIEFLKVHLSKGRYSQLMSNGTMDSEYALDLVDTEAYLSVLLPGGAFKKDFNVESLRDLGLDDSLEVVKSFKEQVLPFIAEIRKAINDSYKKKE